MGIGVVIEDYLFTYLFNFFFCRRRPWSPKWSKMEKYKKALNPCIPFRNSQILHQDFPAVSRGPLGKKFTMQGL